MKFSTVVQHLKALLRVLQLDKHTEKQSKRLFQNNGKTIVFLQHQNAGKFQKIIIWPFRTAFI